jgi:hypothetical protein
MIMEPRKQAIIDALTHFMNQRSGLEFANYGDVKAFRAEQRSITKDLHQARVLLDAVKYCDGITADNLLAASVSAYSGRLRIQLHWDQGINGAPDVLRKAAVSYCTGQYFPTEYRRAVCAVLASALWDYTREKAMPPVAGYRVESWSQLGAGRTRHETHATRAESEAQLEELGGRDYGSVCEVYPDDGPRRYLSAGYWLRAHFRKEFGRGIASRWFS